MSTAPFKSTREAAEQRAHPMSDVQNEVLDNGREFLSKFLASRGSNPMEAGEIADRTLDLIAGSRDILSCDESPWIRVTAIALDIKRERDEETLTRADASTRRKALDRKRKRDEAALPRYLDEACRQKALAAVRENWRVSDIVVGLYAVANPGASIGDIANEHGIDEVAAANACEKFRKLPIDQAGLETDPVPGRRGVIEHF